jgi:mRNA-degrading endonuclease YafQ of YafQ-DinJ toxin-antitoxin module
VPPLSIEVSTRFKSEARTLSADQLDHLDEALPLLAATFGQPHRHAGLGIRRLKKDHFEFRLDRDTRVIFTLEGSTAILRTIGNHDDMRRFLKTL